MKQTRREHLVFLGSATAAAGLSPLAAGAESHATEPQTIEIQMLNVHPEDKKQRQVFFPDIVRANVGDTIKFVSVDRGHNSQCDEEGAPEGATLWEGKIGKDVEVTLDAEGAYTYYCKPHRTAGMVGLLLVGDVSVNYDAVKDQRFRAKSKQRYEDIFERADELLASESS